MKRILTVAQYSDKNHHQSRMTILATARASGIACLLIVAVVSACGAGTASAQSWSYETNLPGLARGDLGSAVVDGKVYLFGGNNNGPLSRVDIYEPASQTWLQGTSMPAARYGCEIGVLGNSIYVIGGWTWTPPLPNNNNYVYQSQTNTWTSATSPSHLSAAGAMGTIGGKLYIQNPEDGYDGYRDTFEVYDPAANSWSSLASIPNPQAGSAYGVINGKLYVAGGNNASGVLDVLNIYNPTTNQWTQGAHMPTALVGMASVVVDGKLYAIGGSTGSQIVSTVEIYDPVANSWSTGPSLEQARYSATAAAIGETIYVFGGFMPGQPLTSAESLIVPEPGTLALLGISLAGLIGYVWRKRK
jgi:N-acetylneuraminic acid mutarotase